MVGTKSRSYSNSGRLLEGEYSGPFFSTRPSPKDNNIIQVGSTSIILLIFMSDIFFLYLSDEGCFTFIIHHFVRFKV